MAVAGVLGIVQAFAKLRQALGQGGDELHENGGVTTASSRPCRGGLKNFSFRGLHPEAMRNAEPTLGGEVRPVTAVPVASVDQLHYVRLHAGDMRTAALSKVGTFDVRELPDTAQAGVRHDPACLAMMERQQMGLRVASSPVEAAEASE